MLDSLVQYARKHELEAEPGFVSKVIRWAVVCDSHGGFLQVLDLAEGPKSQGLTFRKCPDLHQAEMKRGGAGCRHFLADSAEVVALLADGEPDGKLLAKHSYFTGLLRQAAKTVPVLAGIADTLGDPAILSEIQSQLRARKAKPTDKVTFSVLGAAPAYLVDSDRWHDWWQQFRRELGRTGKTSSLVRCLGSGELVEPVSTHPKIAGLADVGGLAMGDVLASFKQESFCSYGLMQSANAPVSAEIAALYRAALNDLIKQASRRLAGTKVVHWFKDRVRSEDDPLSFGFLTDESSEESDAQQRARELLKALETGLRPDLLGNRYYVLTLSGASGRVMVRDWIEGPFKELASNVDRWFSDLSIVRRDGQGMARPPRFLSVLAGIVRDLKDLPRPLEARMWRVAVRGEAIPRQAMSRALARFKIDILGDQPLNHARAGLLRAFLIRKGDRSMQPILNEDHPDPAYHCGRLMALLAAVQYRALGDVGAGIVQRYYAAASTTPALVLGRLVRTAQFHLDKLDRGLARWHEGRIADTFGRIRQEIPATLSLEEQSVFALGYYQQIAFDRARTKAASAPGAPESAGDASHAEPQEIEHV
jgi:CRISPR-associated protein Csd1